MRYGIISDIHSNLEALNVVLKALSKERIDRYISPGDIVGYGANPKECIKIVKGLEPLVVCGNHEAGCTGSKSADYFNEAARRAVIWTRDGLNDKELEYLKGLGLVLEEEDFTLVHGTLQEPQDFLYMFNYQSASATFRLMKTQVCFIGHTHTPGVFILDNGNIEYVHREEIEFVEGKKYIVNAGSVGQPRDEDSRACYCVYDSDKKTLQTKRIAYNIEKAQSKILKAGLPGMLAARLSGGR